MSMEVVTNADGSKTIIEPVIASKLSRPLTEERITVTEEELRTSSRARLIARYETDQAFRKRTAPSAFARAKAQLIEERAKKLQHQEHADQTRAIAASKPPKVQPRSAVHFCDEISIMGLSGMPVEDDGEWDEMLSPRYWSRGVQENAATFFTGKRLHIMESGNYRGTIEVVQIDRDPDMVADKHRVEVKKIA
jgi:hypothetical protein